MGKKLMEVNCDRGGRGIWEVKLDCLNIRIREIQVESGAPWRKIPFWGFLFRI